MIDVPMSDPDQFEDPLSNFEPVKFDDELERALMEEPVSAIQSQPFFEIEVSTPIRHAVQVLQRRNVSSLLVVDAGRLVGIFTERDVLERVAERFASISSAPVGDVMTPNPLVVFDTDSAATALAAIAAAGYRHVPVLNQLQEVVGILSPRRVFAFIEHRLKAVAS